MAKVPLTRAKSRVKIRFPPKTLSTSRIHFSFLSFFSSSLPSRTSENLQNPAKFANKKHEPSRLFVRFPAVAMWTVLEPVHRTVQGRMGLEWLLKLEQNGQYSGQS